MGDELVSTSADDGRKLWSLKLKGDLKKQGGHLAAPPVVVGEDLFVATLVGEVLQVDSAKGTVRRRYPVGSPLRFSPVVAQGRLYVGTQDGKVVCLRIASE
jgi:outer membrane protein assembly factor BamB